MGPLCWLLQLEQVQNCEEGRYHKQFNLHSARQQGAAPTQQTDLSDKDPLWATAYSSVKACSACLLPNGFSK